MKTRLSITLAALSIIVVMAGCRLGDRPPWSPTPATAQNPYGKQLVAQQGDPFLQNGQQYAAHSGNQSVGRVTIPSAGHPVPNTAYSNNRNTVVHTNYVRPSQPVRTFQPPAQPMHNYQPPRQPQQPNVFQPPANVNPMPGHNQWQPHQPQVQQPQAMGSPGAPDQSPFVPYH